MHSYIEFVLDEPCFNSSLNTCCSCGFHIPWTLFLPVMCRVWSFTTFLPI